MALEIIESSRIKTAWSTKKCISLAVFSLVVGIAIFIVAYISMKQNIWIGSYNKPTLSWLIAHRDPQITNIMKIITTIAGLQIFAGILSIGTIIWAFYKREIWRPFIFVSAVGIAAAVSTFFKSITMNGRPDQVNMIAPFELDYSFPSGHTISVVICLLVLGYLIYSRHYSFGRFFSWAIITILGTGIVAISRLYLGYHWLTDVVASIGLGFIILALVIFIDRIFVSRFKKLE